VNVQIQSNSKPVINEFFAIIVVVVVVVVVWVLSLIYNNHDKTLSAN